jgi:hypothetical protein
LCTAYHKKVVALLELHPTIKDKEEHKSNLNFMKGTCQWQILRVADVRAVAGSMGDQYPFQFLKMQSPHFNTATYPLDEVKGAAGSEATLTPSQAEAALWDLMSVCFD